MFSILTFRRSPFTITSHIVFLLLICSGSSLSSETVEQLWKKMGQDKTLQERKMLNEKMVQMSPDSAYGHFSKGYLLDTSGDLERGIQEYCKAIEIDRTIYPAYWNRGLCYRDKGVLDKAIEDFSKVIELNPPQLRLKNIYVDRGIAYEFNGDLDKALDDYSRVIEKIDPNYSYAYYGRGNVFRTKEMLKSAIHDYTKAIELNPTLVSAYVNRGVIFRQQRNFKNAEWDHLQAIKIDPNFILAYYGLGVTYRYTGELDKAIKNYSKAIELDKNYKQAYRGRGECRVLQRKYFSGYRDLFIGGWHPSWWGYKLPLIVLGILVVFLLSMTIFKIRFSKKPERSSHPH